MCKECNTGNIGITFAGNTGENNFFQGCCRAEIITLYYIKIYARVSCAGMRAYNNMKMNLIFVLCMHIKFIIQQYYVKYCNSALYRV